MNLLTYFRKSAGAGWVCKSAVRLQMDGRKTQLFRPGQEIYTGDFRYEGQDLALLLDILAGPEAALADERPQSISAAMAA
ncbi:hypothetical protein [Acidocella sp.]|uniref:hypothetical protein n=1 Tax=Acidocella sp. TaxID=50710 RepID=UPI0026277F28|nr:hypothetical protein [Acidocella sp.]